MGNGDDSNKIITTAEMEKISLDVSASIFSRDLLQRFEGSTFEYEAVVKHEDEDIELNLGLSLGGRFGADNTSKKLLRSSSVAGYLSFVRDDSDVMGTAQVVSPGLARTSSLPAEETEEEWKKRKILQTLRRMEAKRRRSDKQRILKGDCGNLGLEGRCQVGVKNKCLEEVKKLGFARQGVHQGGILVGMGKGKEICEGGSGFGQVVSKGSFGKGSGGELSPTGIPIFTVTHQDVASSISKSKEDMSKLTGCNITTPVKIFDASKSRGSNPSEDMPCVFTVGDGPNGKRVDGILYKYGKGKEVRIMCVCCGNFHSPAEFVKHAGGTDTDHPLKHIVVNPHSSSLF